MTGRSENPLRRLVGEIHRRSLWQVLSVYVVASWVALQVVDILVDNFGLPEWFPAFAVGLLIVGLPIVLATAFVQEGGPGRASDGAGLSDLEEIFSEGAADAEGAATDNGGARTLFTWRNAITGGVLAFALWGVVAAGWILFGNVAPRTVSNSSSARPSLAVLPFDNLSADEENAYFAAGIHEEILTQLSRIAGIKLISRTSVLQYENAEKSLSQIAEELGVSSVLEGSVQRAGDDVRITTQLIDAERDEHLWAERYDRRLSDIFQIQTDVATRIVEELRGVLTPEEQTELARRPTDDLEAYAHYLRGHEHFRNLWTEEDTRAATEAYQRAVELDPSFTAAWTRLIHTRLWLSWSYREYDERPRARTALERLEGLAPDSPETRLARGLWLYYGVQRYDDALEEVEALEAAWPGNADVIRKKGALYRRLGRWEEAVRTMERAFELDPADAGFAGTISQTYAMMRRFDEAERYARMAVALDPTVPTHWVFLLSQRMWRGDTAAVRSGLDSAAAHVDREFVAIGRAMIRLNSDRAEEGLQILRELSGQELVGSETMVWAAAAADRPALVAAWADTLRARADSALAGIPDDDPMRRSGWRSTLALAHAYLGNEEEAVRLADDAVEHFPVSHDAFYGPRLVRTQAEVYTIVGRHDDAVDRLRYLLSIPADQVTVPLLRVDPRWDPLRGHPSFQALLEEYG